MVESSFYEICLKASLEIAKDDEMAAYDMPDYVFSKMFEQRMKQLSAHTRNNRYHNMTNLAKVIIIAAIIAALTITGYAISKIVGYDLTDFGVFSSVNIGKEFGTINSELKCGYIPDGFELTEETCKKAQITCVYENDNGKHIVISKQSDFDEIHIDTENMTPHIISESGIDYLIYGSGDNVGIMWLYDKCIFYVYGDVSEKELIKIAKNSVL